MSGPIHFKSAEEQAAEGFEPLPNSGSTTGQPSLMQKGFNPSSASDSQFSQGGFGSAVDSGSGFSQQGNSNLCNRNMLPSSHVLIQTSLGFKDTSSTGDNSYDQTDTSGSGFTQGGFKDTSGDTSGGGFSQGGFKDTSDSGFSQGGFQDTSPNAGFSQGGFQDTSDLTSRPDSNTLTAGKADQTFSESGTPRSENDTAGTTSSGGAVGDYTQGGFNDDSGVGKQGNFGHFEEGGR
ncbi:hypothetical protein MMC11_003070 [Xylographa trunciseda]|nr:hypothetical protein [Xylographa trunciseda]